MKMLLMFATLILVINLLDPRVQSVLETKLISFSL